MLPPRAHDAAHVVAAQAGLLRGLGAGWRRIAAADDCVIVQVAETAALNPVSRAIDLITTPEAEIDRAAGRIVAEHRRGGAAIDVDPTIGVRVGEIGAGETVRLGHRKSVLEHDDIADPERVARVRATDRNADVARAVSLLEGDAWALLQQVLDREGGLILDALAAEGGDGLSRRLRQGAGPSVGCGFSLRCGSSLGRHDWYGCRRPRCDHSPSDGGFARRRFACRTFRPRGRHDHFGNAYRAGLRRSGRAALGRGGSRWADLRFWRLRRLRRWRRRILRLPRHWNKHDGNENHDEGKYWRMVARSDRHDTLSNLRH
jgi:hypothetical protein